MKIDDRSNLGAVSTSGGKGVAGADAGTRQGTSQGIGGSSDRAELSGLAGKISQAVGRDTADRAAKVEQLRLQVASGGYQADSAAISSGIVNEALANTGGSPTQ